MSQIKTIDGNIWSSAYSQTVLRTETHSRIALYFAGVNVDSDKVLTETIPSTYERAQIIASHPVATARFF